MRVGTGMFHARMKRECLDGVYTKTMNDTFPIAVVGELIGDQARSAILVALLDGRARTAGELALNAEISAQSASGHLSKLLDGGLVKVRSAGRHRYYSLAGPEVAHAMEALGAIATKQRGAAAIRTRASSDLYLARTCYDHLAGQIAVELAARLEKTGVLLTHGELNFELGPHGESWFSNLGIDVEELRRSRRCFARQCVDWTERRPHLAGMLGAALCSRLIELGWITRRRQTRALRVTERGIREFRTRFDLQLPLAML
jgi:DNA-binding transcriptional ArsR family regulator